MKGVLVGKFQGTRILFYGRVPNSIPPLRGSNSTTTNNITGTTNFNTNNDNFLKFSSQGLFESIVINLYPRSVSTLAAVILGFGTLSGTMSTPVTFIGEYPLGYIKANVVNSRRITPTTIQQLCDGKVLKSPTTQCPTTRDRAKSVQCHSAVGNWKLSADYKSRILLQSKVCKFCQGFSSCPHYWGVCVQQKLS